MKTYQIIPLLLFTLFLSVARTLAAPSEAEFRKLQETWTLQTDGSQEYRCYKELTLFTHTAMNSTYGETFITYNPAHQELKIHDAYVRQKDGSIVRTPVNAFVEVLPQEAADAPAFNHLKEMVIVHTGLELGATIYLDYSIISKPGYLPEIDVCKSLLESSPVKEYTLTFVVPENKPVNYETLQVKAQPKETFQNGNRQVQWKLQNLPASSRSPEVHLQNGDIPGILFSTYPSAQAALKRIYQQFDAPGKVSALAQKLTAGYKTNTEKLLALADYVRNQIIPCPVAPSVIGWQIRPAAEITRSLYGTEYEKVNLLTNLLKAVNIPATPLAVYRVNAEPDHCGLEAIGELIVEAQADGKEYRLSPASSLPAGLNGSFCMALDNGEKTVVKTAARQIDYTANIVLNKEDAQMEISTTLSNDYLPYQKNLSGAVLPQAQNCKVSTNVETTTVTGSMNTPLNHQDDYLFLQLPEFLNGINRFSYARYNSKRPENLRLTAQTREHYSYTVQIPAELELCTPVQEKRIQNNVGTLATSYKLENNVLYVSRTLELNKPLISPADYPAFRQLITEWADPNGQQLLFKMKK